jgi:hypothetical protein
MLLCIVLLIYYTCDVNICVEIDPSTHMLCTRLCPWETGVTRWGTMVHSEAARRRCNPTPTSNRAQPGAVKGKIGARLGWLPQVETPGPLNSDRDTARALVDGVVLRLRGESSGEHGQK